MPLPTAPPVINNDTTSSTRITPSWPAISGATGYDVRWNSGLSGGSEYGPPVHVTTTSYDSGTSLTPNTAYVYQVRATRSPFASAWSAPDLATTSVYTHADANNHVAAGNLIVAVDTIELRAVVYSARKAASFPAPYSYTYPDSSLAGGIIHLENISQLRAALDQARTSLGLPAVTYTDSPLMYNSTPVRAAHINELRDGVQ